MGQTVGSATSYALDIMSDARDSVEKYYRQRPRQKKKKKKDLLICGLQDCY